MKPSKRSDVAPFYVMEVMKAAAEMERAGNQVLHLEVGQPSTAAPEPVLAAAEHGLRTNRLGYTHASGTDALRDRIARHYADAYGLSIPAGRVAVTAGASGGFVLAMLAAFDAGDRVGITEPGYAAYRNIIEALGLELVGIPVGLDSRFVPSIADLDQAAPLDGLVMTSPSNPTGTTLTEPEQRRLVDYCTRNGIRYLADEIYHGITYTGPAPTALAASEEVIVIQSFSKYYSMTGWRLGWLILPEDLVRPVERLAQNLFIAPSTLAQHAASAAFDSTEELDANVARYAESRAILLAGLTEMGLTDLAPPDGAFYVWADISSLGKPSQELCSEWLTELGVAVTPGVDFDPPRGDGFVRFSYSEGPHDIAKAVARLSEWIARQP